jgi:HemX protein
MLATDPGLLHFLAMIVVLSLLVAVACYACAAALAVTPLARPIGPPVQGVVTALGVGVLAHLVALVATGYAAHEVPIEGLGPALSVAGLTLAVVLLLAESWARDVILSLIGAPLAAGVTAAAVFLGWQPAGQPRGAQGAWLVSHVAVSFIGIAALATAAAAGALYLVERRELKSRRFGSVFRSFPPLDTLDRVNHLSALVACVALTLGMALAASYTIAYDQTAGIQVVWGTVAWLAAALLAGARQLGGWQARRAALASTVAFAVVIASYFAARALASRPGYFL